MKIHVLALDGAFDTGLSAVLDILGAANELSREGPRFDVRLVGLRKSVKTAQGFHAPTASRVARPDVAVVLGMGFKTPDALRKALALPDVAAAGKLIRRWAEGGTLVCGACTGTFVLASAGLLDGKSATTTWWLAPLFRELYPEVALDESRMVVAVPGCVTAGAALAHLDLALWLVRRTSPSLAALVARYLVIDPRPSQAPFVIPDHLAHEDPVVERFEKWARKHLPHGFSLGVAARSVGASERTLARRLRVVLGKSPLSYFQDIRVERAVHLLKTSSGSVDEIAAQVGYADAVTLRTLLRRKLGRGVREIRARA